MSEEQEVISEQPHSVKFAMNAKGLVSGELKVYSGTPEEAFKVACVMLAQMEAVIRSKNGI